MVGTFCRFRSLILSFVKLFLLILFCSFVCFIFLCRSIPMQLLLFGKSDGSSPVSYFVLSKKYLILAFLYSLWHMVLIWSLLYCTHSC